MQRRDARSGQRAASVVAGDTAPSSLQCSLRACQRMKAISSIDTPRRDRRAYAPRQAFAVDPKRPQRYRLRLSRYMVLAQDISDWAGAASLAGQTLSVLDVGCGWGPMLNQLEAEPHFDNIRISAC